MARRAVMPKTTQKHARLARARKIPLKFHIEKTLSVPPTVTEDCTSTVPPSTHNGGGAP